VNPIGEGAFGTIHWTGLPLRSRPGCFGRASGVCAGTAAWLPMPIAENARSRWQRCPTIVYTLSWEGTSRWAAPFCVPATA